MKSTTKDNSNENAEGPSNPNILRSVLQSLPQSNRSALVAIFALSLPKYDMQQGKWNYLMLTKFVKYLNLGLDALIVWIILSNTWIKWNPRKNKYRY